MKYAFLVSAISAAAMASPVLAQDTAGSVSGAYTQRDVDGLGEINVLDVDATVATPIFTDWTVTLSAKASHTDYADYDVSESGISGSAFLTKKLDTVRLGGFYATKDSDNDITHTFGAVAQKYYDKVTLTSTGTYSTVYNHDAWALTGEVAYYATPALRLNAGAKLEYFDSGDWIDRFWIGKVGAEYQIKESRYSVFVDYTRTFYNDHISDDSHQVGVGIRYNFGGDLQSRDRAGANLNSALNWDSSI